MGDKFGIAFNEASEEWKEVPLFPYQDDYEISSHGRFRRKNGRMLSPWARNQHGHLAVSLWHKNKQKTVYIHKLVALAFIGPQPSEKNEIRHLDGDHTNNCASNLAWGTSLENSQDCKKHGRIRFGDYHKNTKIKDKDLPVIFDLKNKGYTQEKIAELFGVHRVHVGDILNGSKRSYVQSIK